MANQHGGSKQDLPLGEFKYHAFLTHNWGPKPWKNHQLVSIVNAGLEKRGLNTWFDQNQMKGDIPRIMTKGVQQSCVVVVFITKEYILKVDSDDYDACKFEFDHAMNHRKPKNMIPVLMERVARPWNGPVGAILGNFLYVDMTDGPTEQTITELCKMIVQRIEVEVGPCSSSSLLPTPNPTDSVVDELATILNEAKLGESERETVEVFLRNDGFNTAHAILLMTEDRAKQMGIKPGYFLQIVAAAKNVQDTAATSSNVTTAPNSEDSKDNGSNPQQALSKGAVGAFENGFVFLRNTEFCWRNNYDDYGDDTPWNPVQDPQLGDAVAAVVMGLCRIQGRDVIVFCQYLLFCPNVIILDLSSNGLGDEAAHEVAKVLPSLPKLKKLYFTGNDITAKGAKDMSGALPSLPHLQLLWLSNNEFGDEGARDVAKALPFLRKLTELRLSGNDITVKGVKHLCGALPSLSLLKSLTLGENKLGDEGVREVVKVLRGMPSLTFVDLGDNGASERVKQTAEHTLSFMEDCCF